MLKKELSEKIEKSIQICKKHIERIEFAASQLNEVFPLMSDEFQKLGPDKIAFIDQFLFRFSKLQDEIGNKLFRSILVFLDEDIETLPFRDILGKLEKLQIINSRNEWLFLKEIRNELAHEYPENEEQQFEALNTIFGKQTILCRVFEKCVEIYKY